MEYLVYDATKKFDSNSDEHVLFQIQSQSKFTESNAVLFECNQVILESLGMDKVVFNVGEYVCMWGNSDQRTRYIS